MDVRSREAQRPLRRRWWSLLVKIEGYPLKTQHARHRPSGDPFKPGGGGEGRGGYHYSLEEEKEEEEEEEEDEEKKAVQEEIPCCLRLRNTSHVHISLRTALGVSQVNS